MLFPNSVPEFPSLITFFLYRIQEYTIYEMLVVRHHSQLKLNEKHRYQAGKKFNIINTQNF